MVCAQDMKVLSAVSASNVTAVVATTGPADAQKTKTTSVEKKVTPDVPIEKLSLGDSVSMVGLTFMFKQGTCPAASCKHIHTL